MIVPDRSCCQNPGGCAGVDPCSDRHNFFAGHHHSFCLIRSHLHCNHCHQSLHHNRPAWICLAYPCHLHHNFRRQNLLLVHSHRNPRVPAGHAENSAGSHVVSHCFFGRLIVV